MKIRNPIWAATGVVAALVFATFFTHRVHAAATEFHVISQLKLPTTPVPNDYHHLHVSVTDTERFLTVTDSRNIMTIVNVTDGSTPVLARQIQLPANVAHGDPVVLMGGVVLIAQGNGESDISGPETVTFLNVTEGSNCNVAGKFKNVTGMQVDSTQSHIYLISGNELWILGGRQHWHSTFSR